jgi:hypothetical protein
MILMFAPAWVHVLGLFGTSIAFGVLGLGFLLGPAVDLMVIGGLIQFGKMLVYAFLLRTWPRIPLAMKFFGIFYIAMETLFVALSVFSVTYVMTENPHMPPGMEGWETWLRWLAVGVATGADLAVMAMLPAPLEAMCSTRKRYA